MHKAKAFFLVCAGVFLLALAYHLGVRTTRAASTEEPAAVALAVYLDALGEEQMCALASNGDVRRVTNRTGTWSRNSNIFIPGSRAKLPWPDPESAE